MTELAASNVSGEPVFIVGCGRSGTTVLYEMLARHDDAAWLSTWTDRTRRPELAVFNRLFKRGWHSQRFGPRPSEGYRLWDAALAQPGSLREASLGAGNATPDVVRRVGLLVERHRRYGGGTVFLNKNTRNSRRVPFLHVLYPRGRFIHVLRSPLDTVSSLLQARWWRGLPLWWKPDHTPQSLADQPIAEARLAAELWLREASAVLDAREELADNQYTEVRYEDLVRSPAQVMASLLDWIGLERGDATVGRLVGSVSQASVGAYRRRLSAEQASAAWAMVEERATGLEYSR